MSRGRGSCSFEGVAAPDWIPVRSDLRAIRLALGSDEIVVLSYPIEGPRGAVLPEGVLTASERAVLEGLLGGQSNAELARSRQRSIRTVSHQVAAIFRKLDVGSRRELIARYGTPGGASVGRDRHS